MSNRRKLAAAPPPEVTDPQEIAKAVRDAAERFVDQTVEMLLEKELVPDRETALRETAIQSAVNATLMFNAVPPEVQAMIAASLQSVAAGA